MHLGFHHHRSVDRLVLGGREHKKVRNAARAAARDFREITGCFYTQASHLKFDIYLNQTAHPASFKINRSAEKRARLRSSGPYGIFHSHILSEANPGPGDKAHGPSNGYAVIYDVIGDEFRLW